MTLTVRPVQFRSFAFNYLDVTSRGLTTISLLPEIVYGCNSDRARSGAKNASCLGDWNFSIISGDSERECTHVVGLVRLVSLTLLTASPRERTFPRLLVMAKLTL